MTRRKWALGVSLAAMVGAAFWMRELASWRPVTVAKVNFKPTKILFSRDGKLLLVNAPSKGIEGVVFNIENGEIGSAHHNAIRDFDKKHGLETFPRVWIDDKWRLVFSLTSNRNIVLAGWGAQKDLYLFRYADGFDHVSWSKERGEVYREVQGEIHIWNWSNGRAKRRVKYSDESNLSAKFSPDGKWLITAQYDNKNNGFLRRYDVQSGKMVALINQCPEFSDFGFSPDGRFFWFVQKGGSFNVLRADNWKWLTGADCAGPVKWVANNRVGIVQAKSFEWLNVKNSGYVHNRRQLPGPSASASDWALSPDGKWIYSCEPSKTIRKWRAR